MSQESKSKLFVEVRGQGRDVILIHGWGLHGGVWRYVADELSKYYRVHLIDLPGHGFSGFGQHAFSLDYVTKLITTTLQPRLNNQAICIGWSLGGTLACNLALCAPLMVERLITVASTPRFTMTNEWPYAISSEILDEFIHSSQQDLKATIFRFLSLQTQDSQNAKECLRQLRHCAFARGEPDPSALIGALKVLRNTDLRDCLSDITQPSLLIGGEKDPLVPTEALIYSIEQIPNSKLNIINGAGHVPFISHCELFNQSVRSFIGNES